ncbi:MAG: hypothetical protein ACYST9_00435 [Planctomycetota bacterium]|jgi:hypothetical protein
MLRRILIITIIAVACVFCLNGCKKRSGVTQLGHGETETTSEYEAQAKEQINKENMAQELERIEKEMEQDISQEQ